MLHTKRSFAKHPRNIDSPAYDASEEDNDPLTDDGASSVSIPVTRHQPIPAAIRSSHPKPSPRTKHHLAATFLSDSDGVDSPTYDGDVESNANISAANHAPHYHHHHSSSSTSTLGTPFSSSSTNLAASVTTPITERANPLAPVRLTQPPPSSFSNLPGAPPASATERKPVPSFTPASLTPEDIQSFVRKAIQGEPWRKYKINPPPTGRPVRIYADGVYDLFHFGHALQLRQAKLSFPSVYLLAGVNTDEDVRAHKAQGIMTHAERCEAARHCRWVDEVIPDAPWIIDESFLQKHQIDYVAHDEDPYASSGHDDVYGYVKSQGKFIPTRRTPGVSTSDLLERIVSGYRNCNFDDKLTKMGHAELRAEGSDYDDKSRRASRAQSPVDASADNAKFFK